MPVSLEMINVYEATVQDMGAPGECDHVANATGTVKSTSQCLRLATRSNMVAAVRRALHLAYHRDQHWTSLLTHWQAARELSRAA